MKKVDKLILNKKIIENLEYIYLLIDKLYYDMKIFGDNFKWVC